MPLSPRTSIVGGAASTTRSACGPIAGPPFTPNEWLVPETRAADVLLDQKIAGEAHASQTRPLVELLGRAPYREWWRTESFRRAAPAWRSTCAAS
jgi:hypothetical protein